MQRPHCKHIYETSKGSSKTVIIFTSIASVRWEGGGQGPPKVFQKMLLMVHCDYEKGSKNQLFILTVFVGRERSQKRVLLLIMLTILDDS